MRPNDFIINSDFQSTLLRETISISVNIPASFVLPADQSQVKFIQEVTILQSSLGVRAVKITSTKYPGRYDISAGATLVVIGDLSGYDSPWYATVFIEVAGNKFRLIVDASDYGYDPDPQDTTVINSGQTITAKISTFISPFTPN